MTRPFRNSERRAMADALRHMHQSGVRYIRHGAGASDYHVRHSLDRVILPGRDGIGLAGLLGAPAQTDRVAGVVSPRHAVSSQSGDVVPPSNLAGRNGIDAPVAPAPFAGGQQGGNGVEQNRAGVGHSASIACDGPKGHGAARGRAVP